MKIVHVVEALEGGVYTYFRNLSHFFGDEAISKNVETTIIYSGNRKGIEATRIKTEFSNGVTLIPLDMVREISPLRDLRSIFELKKLLKKINPDVIHLHSSKAGVVGRVACFLLFKKKKVFYTPHGYAFLRTDISKTYRKLYHAIEKSLQSIFGGIIVACGDTEFEIAKTIGKSKLVRNGIDITTVSEYNLPHQNKNLTIGIVGRITAARNPELFNEIAIRFPDFDFVWIGDGELHDAITAPNIKITGWSFDQKAILQQLNKIDIYLQTSLWEGLPIALLEAMAMQKPVVATNIIGNKDIVLHDKTGFLFTKIEELDSYFGILNDPGTRTLFGKNALERCRDLFDTNKNFKQLLSLYQN